MLLRASWLLNLAKQRVCHDGRTWSANVPRHSSWGQLRAQHAAFEQHLPSHARRTLLRGSWTRADGSKHGRRVAGASPLLAHMADADHPDPFGHTVAEIGRIIARERRLWRRCGVTEFGVFFDWASMH